MRNVLAVLILAGCATTAAPRGAVVARVDREARLCLDGASLQPGQKVQFKRRVCAYQPPKNLIRTCKDVAIESAEVVRVLDERCVMVLVPGDGQIEPGDEIEIALNK